MDMDRIQFPLPVKEERASGGAKTEERKEVAEKGGVEETLAVRHADSVDV